MMSCDRGIGHCSVFTQLFVCLFVYEVMCLFNQLLCLEASELFVGSVLCAKLVC